MTEERRRGEVERARTRDDVVLQPAEAGGDGGSRTRRFELSLGG